MVRPATLKKWSEKEDQFILTHGATMSSRELMEHLPGRTEQAVKARCHILKVRREGPLVGRDGVVRKKWSPEEEAFLTALSGQVTIEEAAEKLGRSKDSLRTCLKKLSVTWPRQKPKAKPKKKVKKVAKKKPKPKKKAKVKPKPKKKVIKKKPKKAKKKVAPKKKPVPKPKPIPKVAVTQQLLRERLFFAKATVFLENMKKAGAAVSLFGVMSQLKIEQPWTTSPKKDIILEAAGRLGMRVYEEKGMVMMK